jgi:excisionase family DNA binding protein
MNSDSAGAKSSARFLTVSEAAELLRLAPKSLYTMASEKRIPHRHAGRRLLFLESELIEWTRPVERKRKVFV